MKPKRVLLSKGQKKLKCYICRKHKSINDIAITTQKTTQCVTCYNESRRVK